MEAVRDWRIPKASTKEVIREEHHHTETHSEKVPQDILDRIAELERARSATDARYMEQEHIVQMVIQAADALLSRIEQHKDVINGIRAEVLGMREAIAGVGADAEQLHKKAG